MCSKMASNELPRHKAELIDLCIRNQILKFGSFTLKSGRVSPYFFNAGLFNTARTLSCLADAFAQTLLQDKNLPEFDVIFGPAYKGIPLATLVCARLGALDEKFLDVGYSFNRKEKKDHGEGGGIVGVQLKGKRVLVVDDVITAGTAMREATDIIKAEGGILAGIVVCLDRQERTTDGDNSAIENCKAEYNVPITAIITLEDLIVGVPDETLKDQMRGYGKKYAPTSRQ
ncbi:orotate phosphoribosyltransferase [Orbilia oligospora]|uniref:Orotate phosphoribosyltransferase n=2 Tax=Orbilia oligospora TaxID=2813651 RepID=A0A7C8VEW1_ORBOL|nr:orotate phosphoribosyltransferase [Orbilia oligospora]